MYLSSGFFGSTKFGANHNIKFNWVGPLDFFFFVSFFMISDYLWLICPDSFVTNFTFNKRVSKPNCTYMTRGLPNFFWHKYCCPHTINILTFNDKFLPEILLNIVPQFHP